MILDVGIHVCESVTMQAPGGFSFGELVTVFFLLLAFFPHFLFELVLFHTLLICLIQICLLSKFMCYVSKKLESHGLKSCVCTIMFKSAEVEFDFVSRKSTTAFINLTFCARNYVFGRAGSAMIRKCQWHVVISLPHMTVLGSCSNK